MQVEVKIYYNFKNFSIFITILLLLGSPLDIAIESTKSEKKLKKL
jgi:hypothetical protein